MIPAERKTIDVFVQIKAWRQKSVLVSDGAVEVWLPLSLIDIEPGNKYNQADITLPEWLAKEKGLI